MVQNMSGAVATSGGREVSPETVAAFFQDIIIEYQSFKKLVRRSEPREPASIPVQVLPLDADLEPTCEPFHTVTRDISSGGIGLFHSTSVDTPLVQIEFSSPFTGEILNIVARVEHSTPCGKYFIIGCQFGADEQDDQGDQESDD